MSNISKIPYAPNLPHFNHFIMSDSDTTLKPNTFWEFHIYPKTLRTILKILYKKWTIYKAYSFRFRRPPTVSYTDI